MKLKGTSIAALVLLLPLVGGEATAGPIPTNAICGFSLNGANWVNSCPAATHTLLSTAYMAGQIDGNPFDLAVSGTVSVWTGAGAGGTLQDEIYDMYLSAPGVVVMAGDGTADGSQTAGARAAFYTGGTITQQGNGEFADSFFDVFFEITLQTPGGPLVLHNNVAQHTMSVTDQLPPVPGTRYGDPQAPLVWLYDSTNQLRGYTVPGIAEGGIHMDITPEPASWMLFGAGMVLVGLGHRRSPRQI